jgi:hypothetical protein
VHLDHTAALGRDGVYADSPHFEGAVVRREHPWYARAAYPFITRYLDTQPKTVEQYEALARKQTGLSDFGDPGYREGLRRILDAADQEASFTPAGRLDFHLTILSGLATRLVIADMHRRHPEARERAVTRPIFVLGLPRSGTTHLHNLLALDPASRALPLWELNNPVPYPAEVRMGIDLRPMRARIWMAFVHSFAPEMNALHPVAWDNYEECAFFLRTSFVGDLLTWTGNVPSYVRWLDSADLGFAYREYRDWLKVVQATSPSQRWVLKYPAHIGHLDALLDAFPDACIVQTHRDPIKSVASIASVIALARSMTSFSVDPIAIGAEMAAKWKNLLDQGMATRDRREVDAHDVAYEALTASPIDTIRAIYAHFDLPFTAEYEAILTEAIKHESHEGGGARHRYTPADYGIDESVWRPRFAAYVKRYGVPTGA